MTQTQKVARSQKSAPATLPKQRETFEMFMNGIAPERAKALLLDPKRLDSFFSWIERKFPSHDGPSSHPWDIAAHLLDKVQHNNALLKQIFHLYENPASDPGFIASQAVSRFREGDSYFKEFYQHALKTNVDWRIQRAALRRITDQDFKCRAIVDGIKDWGRSTTRIEKHPGEIHIFESNKYYGAIGAISTLKRLSDLQRVRHALPAIGDRGLREGVTKDWIEPREKELRGF